MAPIQNALALIAREAMNIATQLSSRDEIGQATENDRHPGISHPEISPDPMVNPQVPLPLIIVLCGTLSLGIAAGLRGSFQDREEKRKRETTI
ncbi:hypothetical protein HYALB_00005224 [Hymenoscyphus albidus]|uniref:Uncharacterized protein n=1 Tax=Hymenoscyphus albidus TaxID=595503 RepID=A0A9N9Q8X4_9HELO|nr:hypothetical protein HYALB_00005224 [Hymenoscyphus albidus]